MISYFCMFVCLSRHWFDINIQQIDSLIVHHIVLTHVVQQIRENRAFCGKSITLVYTCTLYQNKYI